MADRLTWTKRRDRADKLLAKLQECENECHAIGFTRAAHSVNAAKNQVGWDLADEAAVQIAAGRRALQSGGDE